MKYDLTGKKVGKLFVLNGTKREGKSQMYWKCLCDCGKQSEVDSWSLRKGRTKSCGCEWGKNLPLQTKHGYYNSRTYHTWEGMKQRCQNPNATRYPAYGALGVTVCERWQTFENFLEDMGERPEGRTLDRIDPFGNYEPSNCRWSTPKEQQQNQRRHRVAPEEVCPSC